MKAPFLRNLNATWARQVFFTLAEHGAIRVLDAATTLVLIRAFSSKDFGLFSIYQSWVGLALLVLPSLEQALYRDYAKLKSQGLLAAELSIYRNFNFIKIAMAIVIVLVLSLVNSSPGWPVRVSLLALAFALPLSHALYGFLREPLRFELRQRLVAFIAASQRSVLLAVLVTMSWAYPANAVALCSSAICVYFIFGFIWALPSRAMRAQAPSVPLANVWQKRSSFCRERSFGFI